MLLVITPVRNGNKKEGEKLTLVTILFLLASETISFNPGVVYVKEIIQVNERYPHELYPTVLDVRLSG